MGAQMEQYRHWGGPAMPCGHWHSNQDKAHRFMLQIQCTPCAAISQQPRLHEGCVKAALCERADGAWRVKAADAHTQLVPVIGDLARAWERAQRGFEHGKMAVWLARNLALRGGVGCQVHACWPLQENTVMPSPG